MYAKCGSLSDAKQVFDEMPARDVVSWNAMITGYTENGLEEAAVALFWHMQQRRMEPNKVTFICVLKACAPPLSLDQGQQIHIHIVGHGFDTDVVVGSAMVDMYVRFRSIHDAREVFENMTTQDVTLWTSIITGYAQYGDSEEALKLFQQMLHEGVRPDRVIFLSVLRACASLPAMHQGLKIHALIFASGFELDAFVGSALVDMYAKCGSLQHACQVFDKLPIQDVVSWTALISGYVQQGLSEDALFFFCKMKHAGIRPNEVTFVSALSACSPLAAIEQGKLIHLDILKSSSESNLFVASAHINMYAKCGSIDHACSVFRKISNRDIVVWNTMIDGYAQHGNAEAAFQLFEQMNKSGLKMDTFTFVGVLSACNHAGLVNEGWHYFHSMRRDHGIRPSTEHYACMVDILGRAGHLEEANKMVQSISSEHSSSVQMSLLSACRIHGNVELAKNVAMSLFELEPQNEVAYVLLSNVYSASARWQDTAVVRQMMKESGFEKELVQSC